MGIFDSLFKKKVYKGDVVSLRENYRTNEKTAYDGIPTVYYEILRNEDNKRVGSIDLRFTVEGDMYYYGHVGYRIVKEYRGNNYAYHACKILFNIAKLEFGMKELLITCSPENKASYRTLEKLNGEIIDFVNVPEYHQLYMLGETKKYVFKYKIDI